jgi:glucose dehydrogenase
MRIPIIILLAAAVASVAAAQTDWPIYGHDPGGRQYSPLKEIDTSNVSKLTVAWTYDTRPAVVPTPSNTAQSSAEASPARPAPPRNRASQATPLVVGGMLYLSSPYNRIVALEPEMGKKIWEYESDATPSTRGIAYWGGDKTLPPQIVVGTMSGSLFTLNAKTGKLTTTFGDNGKVNLKNGIADDFPNGPILMSTPAAVFKNLLFTGGQLQEAPAKGPSGDVRAWDVHTGKLVWTFHTVPRPGEKNHDAWQGDEWVNRSGTNVWGFMTVDVERGMLFVFVGLSRRAAIGVVGGRVALGSRSAPRINSRSS